MIKCIWRRSLSCKYEEGFYIESLIIPGWKDKNNDTLYGPRHEAVVCDMNGLLHYISPDLISNIVLPK